MKELNIATKIVVCSYEELNDSEKKLVELAKEATRKSYSPYSGFSVGASVLLANGEIITGNNQENAAYPSGLCAERTALFYASSQYPDEPVYMMAIAAFTRGKFTTPSITPCGACRQVMLEVENRFKNDIRILLYGEGDIYIVSRVKDILPLSFNGDQL